MSLINEALKRAKEAQKAAPAPATPRSPLRPTDTTQFTKSGPGWMAPALLVIAAGAGVIIVWHLLSNSASTKPIRTPTEAVAAANATPLVERPSIGVARASTPVPTTAATNAAATIASVPAPTTLPSAIVQDNANTNQTVATNSPPKPAPLRLQAIVFRLPRPSAMISGKTLFVGDKVGDLRVVAIGQDSATLAGNGTTNILSLPQ